MKLKALKRVGKAIAHAVEAAPLATVGSWYAYAASADPDRLPYDLLERATERILTTLPKVDRVVYDLTPNPPRPVEWEM